jgi:hypothetical protein
MSTSLQKGFGSRRDHGIEGTRFVGAEGLSFVPVGLDGCP